MMGDIGHNKRLGCRAAAFVCCCLSDCQQLIKILNIGILKPTASSPINATYDSSGTRGSEKWRNEKAQMSKTGNSRAIFLSHTHTHTPSARSWSSVVVFNYCAPHIAPQLEAVAGINILSLGRGRELSLLTANRSVSEVLLLLLIRY